MFINLVILPVLTQVLEMATLPEKKRKKTRTGGSSWPDKTTTNEQKKLPEKGGAQVDL